MGCKEFISLVIAQIYLSFSAVFVTLEIKQRRIILFVVVAVASSLIHSGHVLTTLGPAWNEQIDAKKTACYRRVLVVIELSNSTVNDCSL